MGSGCGGGRKLFVHEPSECGKLSSGIEVSIAATVRPIHIEQFDRGHGTGIVGSVRGGEVRGDERRLGKEKIDKPVGTSAGAGKPGGSRGLATSVEGHVQTDPLVWWQGTGSLARRGLGDITDDALKLATRGISLGGRRGSHKHRSGEEAFVNFSACTGRGHRADEREGLGPAPGCSSMIRESGCCERGGIDPEKRDTGADLRIDKPGEYGLDPVCEHDSGLGIEAWSKQAGLKTGDGSICGGLRTIDQREDRLGGLGDPAELFGSGQSEEHGGIIAASVDWCERQSGQVEHPCRCAIISRSGINKGLKSAGGAGLCLIACGGLSERNLLVSSFELGDERGKIGNGLRRVREGGATGEEECHGGRERESASGLHYRPCPAMSSPRRTTR